MRISKAMTAGVTMLVIAAVPAAASEAPLYPYHTDNYCPQGLQPVTMGGVICCGKPNQSVTYQAMMSHPAPKKTYRKATRIKAVDCPIGTKGCAYD